MPNDVDVQHEKFWCDLPNGVSICESLLDLRDKTAYMLSKEGDPDANELIADQLGYDTAGVPA